MNLVAKLNDNIALTFGTPIFHQIWSDSEALNKSLKSILLDKEKENPTESKINISGWQSTPDILSWPHAEMETLQSWLKQSLNILMSQFLGSPGHQLNCQINAWGSVTRQGDTNRIHVVPYHHWSGVYFVSVEGDTGDDNPSGLVTFMDPRPAASIFPPPGIMNTQDLVFRPKAGMMLLFPSWLQHGALPISDNGEHIQINFNVVITNIAKKDEQEISKNPKADDKEQIIENPLESSGPELNL